MLSALILIPFLGAAIIGLLPLEGKHSRNIALVTAISVLAINIFLSFQFDFQHSGLNFAQDIPWIEWIGLNYHLGIDGLSFPLVLLNSVLTLIAIVSTSSTVQRPRLYYAMLLLLSGGAVGAFLAQDLLLFFLFYELEIVPLYFLIAIWGGERRGYAAMKFLLYTALSGILVLASFLGLVWLTGESTFDYQVPVSYTHLTLPTILLV